MSSISAFFRAVLVTAVIVLPVGGAWAATDGAVYVVSYLELLPNAKHSGESLIRKYVKDSRTEGGGLRISALNETDRAGKYLLIESWRDPASLSAHESAAHTAEFRKQLEPLSRIPFDRRIYHGFDLDPMAALPGSKLLYVVTHVDVPGVSREAAEGILQQLAAPVRSLPGHVQFDIYQQEDPRRNHFTTLAIWRDRNAFDDYARSAPARTFMDQIAPLLGALYDERVYRSLEP